MCVRVCLCICFCGFEFMCCQICVSVFVLSIVYMLCMYVFSCLCQSVMCWWTCIFWVCIFSGVSGSVSHFAIINYHQSRLLIYCVSGGLCKIEFFRCAVRHKTLFFPSVRQHALWFLCLVMINNTIDYLVLLAITFLLVIVFILLISLYVFWYLFPYKARRFAKQSKQKQKNQRSFS